MSRSLVLFALLISTATLALAASTPTGKSYVRLFHAYEGGPSTIDLRFGLDNNNKISGVRYGQVSKYVEITPASGLNYTIFNGGDNSKKLSSGKARFNKDEYYTVTAFPREVTTSTVVTTATRTHLYEPTSLVYSDALPSSIPANRTKARFINVSPGDPSRFLDVFINKTRIEGDPFVKSLSYTQVTYYFQLPAGQYLFTTATAGTNKRFSQVTGVLPISFAHTVVTYGVKTPTMVIFTDNKRKVKVLSTGDSSSLRSSISFALVLASLVAAIVSLV